MTGEACMSSCTAPCKDAVPQASVAGPQAYDNSATHLSMCLYHVCASTGTVPGMYKEDYLRSKWPVSDVNLLQALAVVGMKKINRWSSVAEMVGSRGQIQCRERYCNVLDPELKSGSLPCLELVQGCMWTTLKCTSLLDSCFVPSVYFCMPLMTT